MPGEKLSRSQFDRRHQALARATLMHDRASSALRAAGFSGAKAHGPAKSWLGAYHEAASAEDAGAKLFPVREAALIALAGPDCANLAAGVEAACLRRAMTGALMSLTPREERILRLRFFADQSLHQVAEALDIKSERVRLIEASALGKLKHRSRSQLLRQHIGTAPRRAKRADLLWAPRGLSAQAALRQGDAPTWAKFRLLDAHSTRAPIGLATAIPKLTGRWSKQDFERLGVLLAEGGAGAKTLRHARAISPDLISVLASLPAPLRQGRIATLVNPNQADLVARATVRVGAEIESDAMRRLRERLSRARTTQHLFRMIVDEIGVRPAAHASALAASWFRPMISIQDMERAAIAFRNCLRAHIPRLLAGNAAYFEARGPSPAIVQIVRDATGRWFLGEVAGIANRPVDPVLYARLFEHLSTHQIGIGGAGQDQLSAQLLHAAGMIWRYDFNCVN